MLPWLLLPIGAVSLTALELRLKQTGGPKPRSPELLWVYTPPQPGAIISSPLVRDDRIYVSAIRDKGLNPGGAVIALDMSGHPVWTFDDDGQMIHMYSSPCMANGRLYVGEGMHANFDCKLTCLDAATGQKHWRFGATHHIESTPVVADGKVYFGAGDDGVYALDAVSGKQAWHFDEERHVDTTPAFAYGKLFVGAGGSRRYPATEVLALDAASGRPVWRVPTELPVWGSPIVDGDHVYVGLGNGRLNTSHPQPAGKLLCLAAETGQRLWECPLPDSVMARPEIDARRVYVSCRDGHVYAAARDDGRVLWKRDLGSPIVTSPAVVDFRLYVAASAGRIVCLDALNGSELNSFDLAAQAQAACQVYSTPAVRPDGDGRARLWVGAELRFPGGNHAALYCLRF